MTRRDIIIVAVLINTGLPAILFMMAMNMEEDQISDRNDLKPILAQEEVVIPTEPEEIQEDKPAEEGQPVDPEDELDPVIQDLTQTEIREEVPQQQAPQQIVKKEPTPPKSETIDVVVKSGDSLDKIARAHGTTVSVLMAKNRLVSDRLKIGQILRVPVGQKSTDQKEVAVAAGDAEYYTLQNGDNPWKIAKKCKVHLDDLLRLNGLDEVKAKRLKPGDRVRIR